MHEEVISNFHLLAVEELREEYCKLHDRYHELCEANESDAQTIHDLKRNLDRATAAEKFLIQELEQLTTATPSLVTEEEHSKTQGDLEELRRKHTSLGNEYNLLQQEYDTLLDENVELRKQLQNNKADTSKMKENTQSSEQVDVLTKLEEENLALLQKLEEFNEKEVQHTFSIAEHERNIEILRDQVNCLEENMRCKRDELEEKSQLLESAQEQLMESNARITMLTTAPENIDRKGNSLFAEVDDHRQAMKQLLTEQKRSYLEMKKTFQESEHEIRRLKRENSAMHTELRACSSIFCKADKTYRDKLNQRIRHLNIANEELERKVKWTEQRLNELANEKGLLWLDSMFSFCKQEADDLKKQLYSVRLKNASLEQELLNSQQDLARWRFESLKSRCLLIDRENLLNENQISFKANNDIEYEPITEQQLQAARPRIVAVSHNAKALINDTNIAQFKSEAETTVALEDEMQISAVVTETKISDTLQSTETETVTKLVDNDEMEISCAALEAITFDDKENIAIDNKGEHKIIAAESTIQIDLTSSACHVNSAVSLNAAQALHVKSFAHESHISVLPLKSHNNTTTAVLPSILSKKRDLFHDETHKNVQFSEKAPIVHNISACNDSNSDTSVNENTCENGSSTNVHGISKTGKTIVKQTRTKSNVIVRHVFVNSSKTKNSFN